MTTKKTDPTMTSSSLDPYDAASPSPEAAILAPENLDVTYEDNPDKPHETSIAQIQVVEEP